MKKKEMNISEPYYYIALVMKGSEKQYLNLLKYIDKRNGAQVIYQCKSLTYMRVTRDDGVKFKITEAKPELITAKQESSS